jgi:hypothetical protein
VEKKAAKVVDCEICEDGSLLVTFDHAFKPGTKTVTITGEALHALAVDHARWPEPGESDFKHPIMTLEDVYEIEEEDEDEDEDSEDGNGEGEIGDSPTKPFEDS